MTRLGLVLASLCASAACVKIPGFQGHGGDGGPGDGDGIDDANGDVMPSESPEQ